MYSLTFSEPVKVTNKITDPAPALQSLLENADAKKSAYEIANQLHKGTNLLDNTGITQDGMDMKIKKTTKTNPEALNWISKNAEALYETGAGLPGRTLFRNECIVERQTDTFTYLWKEHRPDR